MGCSLSIYFSARNRQTRVTPGHRKQAALFQFQWGVKPERCGETLAGILAMLKTESHDFRGHAADGLQRHAGVLHLAVR